VAWGIFYQTVNIGAFLGPLLAGYLRLLEWHYVFYACSGIISLNFLLLLTYEEVDKAARLAARSAARLTASQGGARESLLLDSIREITKPHVALYLLIFSGFWFMFMALFDVLPMHVRDWVDTSDIVKWWFADGKSTSALFNRFAIVSGDGTRIQPEGIVNINAMMIMATCFLFAGFSARMRATTSMVVGTLLSSVALFMIGQATLGWLCALAIAVFSVGEMLSSPKFLEFIGNIAPSNKKAMYLGFSQLPLGIGWTAEGYFGQKMYHAYASRDRFSMELLSDRIDAGTTSAPDLETLTKLAENAKSVSASELLQLHEKGGASLVEVIPVGERFDWLVAFTGESADSLREVLYRTHDVGMIWNIMAGVGVATAVAIWGYGLWLRGRANRVG
jgi:hypothetical protein